jgi:streptomycin 6-kinase
VVTVPEEPRLIGIVGLKDHGEGVVEMTYGIAPRWRGRGLASRAARLTVRWALSLPGVTAVELRIGQDHVASQHVANNAGFAVARTVTQSSPAPETRSRTAAGLHAWAGNGTVQLHAVIELGDTAVLLLERCEPGTPLADTTAERNVMLCTDLDAGNVLAAQREPWLVIDPKPYAGDPTYDVLQHMLNCDRRLAADPRSSPSR